jgi:hypothetical protein
MAYYNPFSFGSYNDFENHFSDDKSPTLETLLDDNAVIREFQCLNKNLIDL